MSIPTQEHQSAGWEAVHPGLLTGLSHGLRDRRRREESAVRLARLTGFAMVFAIGSIFALNGITRSYEPRFGGVTCNDVICNSNRYLSGRLDQDMYSKFFHHIAECKECSNDIVRMRQLAATNDSEASRVTLERRQVMMEQSTSGLASVTKFFRSLVHSWSGCHCERSI